VAPAERSRSLAGLDGRVEILRDEVGVPHCYATSEHDALFTQGWVHATDRLWQLVYDRRRGEGRSAELLGPAGVASDLFHRRMDLVSSVRRDWLALSPESRWRLEAYAQGVNAAREDMIGSGTLPSDLALAGVVPDPWEASDSLLVFRVRHVLMGSARGKLWRAFVTGVLGAAAAASLVEHDGGGHVACVPPGAPLRAAPGGDPLRPTGAEHPDIGGSNNWALSGSRTQTGLPLLAGDPHRALEMPNVYVQGHIHCPAWEVLGFSIPGVPGFPHFGHNADVAWSITHGMVDDQDLYRFEQPPQAMRRTETIRVKGAEPVDVEIAVSERGPLIAPDLALCWTATADIDTTFEALWPMLRSRSVTELFDAMTPWVAPANNLLAADREGTIGYQLRGRVPRRARPEAAAMPVPAEDASFGWTGWVAFEELPRVVDPDGGFVFSANNPILADPSGSYLGMDTAEPWRAQRLVTRLAGLRSATPEDMASLHGDRVSIPARSLLERLGEWPLLASWDGVMDEGSPQAAAYSMLRRELFRIVLERSGLSSHLEEQPNRLLPGVLPESSLLAVVDRHLRAGDETLLGGWTWETALRRATEAVEKGWSGQTWGELHHTAQRHPLLTEEFDPPRLPYGGDMDTVQASAYVPSQDLTASTGSVARYCFDLADWDRSGWVVPLGAAGDPNDTHAFDQQDAWRGGRLLPANWSRASVEESASARELLEPAPGGFDATAP